MQEKESGAYSPDTQEDEDSIGTSRPRPVATKTEQAPLTLIISGIFLVILLLLVVIFYNSKLSSNGHVPPELGAEVGAYKDAKVIEAKPIKEDDLIDSNSASSDASATRMAPDSQAPSTVSATSQSAAPAASAASVAPEVQAALTPKTNPQPLPPAPAPALKPATVTQAAPPKPLPPVAVAPKPVAVAPKPVAVTPKPVPVVPKPVAVAPKPVPAPVVAKPAPEPAATAPKAVAGGYGVQIGAFGSNEIANQQLRDSVQPASASKVVEKVDVNGKTFYRAYFKGFASKADAKAFCDKLKNGGKNCFVK